MPTFLVGSERNLTAVTKAAVADKVPPALARRFADAVRAANPGLEFDRLRPGIVVEIPEVPGVPLKPVSPTLDTGRFGSAKTLDALVRELRQAVAAAQSAAAEADQERDATLEVLASGELKETRRAADRTGPTIAGAVKALEADKGTSRKRADSLTAAADEWITEIHTLAEVLGALGG